MTKLYRSIPIILASVGILLLMITINLSILESVCKDPDGGIIRLPNSDIFACIIIPQELIDEGLDI